MPTESLYTECRPGESVTQKNYLLANGIQAEYDAWMEKVNEYLWVTRPDDLYGRRGPLESQKDAETVLDWLHFWLLTGNYNIQLDTGYRLYQLDRDLFLAHYTTGGTLEYLFQMDPV